MEDILLPEEFLQNCSGGTVVDVRTPAEFDAGHIPGAINIPLFSNEERAEVGTLYVRVGRNEALIRGLELVGPKLASFVVEAFKVSQKKPLYIYCWRGGMRSGSMAQLFRAAGIRTIVLKGGYKAYRQSFSKMLVNKPWQFAILGGKTGCGKTDILHSMTEMGHQVIDLEGLAHNKGSAFGYLGEEAQPTTEHFANLIHEKLRTFDPALPVWIEAESPSIGRVFVPLDFYQKMLGGVCIQLELTVELRIENIMKDYGQFDNDELAACFKRVEKRLGFEATARAVEHVEKREAREAILIGMHYYDKGYLKSSGKHWPNPSVIHAEWNDPIRNAHAILQLYSTLQSQK